MRELLTCPVCGPVASLVRDGRTLCCAAGHTFDVAKQGYAGLLTGARAPSADTAAMVRARVEFLAAGHYAPLTRAIVRQVTDARPGVVLDVGAGTGHHLAAVLDAVPDAVGVALDTSAAALRQAARAHDRLIAAMWDTWRPLPLPDASVDVLLDVFAPRNGEQFRRVLRPGGLLLVVTPTVDHLRELRAPFGLLAVDPDKDDRLAAGLAPWFTPDTVDEVTVDLSLGRDDVIRLISMTPSAHHLDEARIAAAAERVAEPFGVTAAFRVSAFRPHWS